MALTTRCPDSGLEPRANKHVDGRLNEPFERQSPPIATPLRNSRDLRTFTHIGRDRQVITLPSTLPAAL